MCSFLVFYHRLNTNTMGLLNLLTAYQKKHLVEFLPYHECDTQSRQAPDLDCLIKLQAQHTQQRHLIFLTGQIFKLTCITLLPVNELMISINNILVQLNVVRCYVFLQRGPLRCSYSTPEME